MTVQVNRGNGWEDLDLDLPETQEPVWAKKRDNLIDMYDYRAVKK